MIQLSSTWLNVAILAVTAIAACLSAAYARKSVNAERSSQWIAKQQAQLSFAEMINGWRPPVTVELSKVAYHWSRNLRAAEAEGTTPNPVEKRSQSMTIEEAEKNDARVEIVIQGSLANKTSEEMLITIRRMKRGGWRPLENECLLLVNGTNQERFILKSDQTVEFTWIDRKRLSDWRAIYHATETDASTADPKFKRPLHSPNLLRRMQGERGIDVLEWDANERHHAGFDVVAESRMGARVATIWSFEPGRSAAVPDPAGSMSGMTSWKLQANTEGPIDDQVIKYRCYYNSTLAQIDTPSTIHLPGRH